MSEKRYLSCAETAKLVREAVKRHFPGTRFSVRSDNYAGGASIHVSWALGPTTKEVEVVAKQFEGKDFDGMIDMACHYDHWLLPDGTTRIRHTPGTEGSRGMIQAIDNPIPPVGAEAVRFGADYIFCERSYGENENGLNEKVSRAMCELQHITYEGPNTRGLFGDGDPDVVQHHAWRLLQDTSFAPGEEYTGLRRATPEENDWQHCFVVLKTGGPQKPTESPATTTPTLTVNNERNGYEIRFPQKPADDILQRMKDAGWRWSKYSSCWYHRQTPANLAFATLLIQELTGADR